MTTKLLPPSLERDVIRAVADVIKLLNLDIRRQNTGAIVHADRNGKRRFVRFGTPGDADFSGTLPGGRRIDIEVKRPGKRPTPEQLERLRLTNELGGVGLWVQDAVDLERALRAIMKGAWVEIDERGNCFINDGKD